MIPNLDQRDCCDLQFILRGMADASFEEVVVPGWVKRHEAIRVGAPIVGSHYKDVLAPNVDLNEPSFLLLVVDRRVGETCVLVQTQ